MNPGFGIALRDRFLNLQFRKKIVLRLAGQDLFMTLLTVRKKPCRGLRRSLFGGSDLTSYELFTNRMLFTEEGRDDFINAEHYVMLGNFERDPDRFQTMREVATEFLQALSIPVEGPRNSR